MEHTYQNIEDFLADDSFVKYAKGEEGESHMYWENWVSDHPASIQMVEDAKLIILGLPFHKVELPIEEVEANLDMLKKELKLASPASQKLPFYRYKAFNWAAAILVLLMGYFLLNTGEKSPTLLTEQTDFGETREILFEDGSRITLNANSSLSYYENLALSTEKELTLEGEAYFDIQKQAEGTFYVIQAGDLTAKVLGTSFNMNTRESRAVLSLDEGAISLTHQEGKRQEIGEGNVAWFDEKADSFVIQEERNEFWNSWMRNFWMIDEAITFERILNRIEDDYGLSWTVEDKTLLQRKLKGSIPTDSPEVLLETLAFIFDIEIVRVGDSALIVK